MASGRATTPTAEHDAILADLARLTTSPLDFDDLLSKVVALAAKLTGADRASILLLDPSGKILQPAALFGMDQAFTRAWRARPILLGAEPLSREAVTTRRVVIVENASLDTRTNKDSVRFFGDRSILVAPLITGHGARERIAGTLFVNHVTSIYAFTNRDIETIEAVASQIAISIENTRLTRSTRRLAAQLRHSFLLAGDTLVASTSEAIDLRAILQRLLELAVDLVDADGGTVAIRDALARREDLVASTTRALDNGALADDGGDFTSGRASQSYVTEPTAHLVRGFARMPILGAADRTSGSMSGSTGDSPDYVTSTLLQSISDDGEPEGWTTDGPIAGRLPLGTMTVWRADTAFGSTDQLLLNSIANYIGVAIEQRRLAEGVLDERARREAAERTQNDFVSMVTHELRTPLALMRGYIATLRRPDVSLPETTVRRFYEGIDAATDRLTRLVDNLLTSTALETGRFITRASIVDFAQVVTGSLNDVAVLDIRRQIDLHILNSTCVVVGDPDQLAQVVLNLIGNAHRYARGSDAIAVTVSCRSAWVRLTVDDTGPGIPEEFLDRIFEKFFRVPVNEVSGIGLQDLTTITPPKLSNNSTLPSGLGLGLYICRQIVGNHRGRIWAENRRSHLDDAPGTPVGTTFVVELPLAVDIESRHTPPK